PHPEFVTFDQGLQPLVRPPERLVVGGQHQYIRRQQGPQFGARPQPVGEWISVRLGWKHRYVRGDARQDLVAGDEDVEVLLPEAGVLGAMAVARDTLPRPSADLDLIAIAQPMKRIRQL